MKKTNSCSLPSKQKGATLFTAIVFLGLMTIVSVSAAKIGMLDILVSGNNQKAMKVFQDTGNRLKIMATTKSLNQAYSETGFTGNNTANDSVFNLANSPANTVEKVTDLSMQYPCERQGQGSSIGANAPPCNLYDFQVEKSSAHSSARDQHNRGAGKMVPNSGSKGSLM